MPRLYQSITTKEVGLIMPNCKEKKVEAVEKYSRINLLGSKKILIEHTTLISIFVIIVFKTIPLLLPDDVSLLYSVSELLLSLPSQPWAYPALFGVLLSFLTWHTMYLDSAVPGVDPPTPLSPSKYREASGADFHINYVFAMVVGPMVAAFMYAGWV